MVNIVQPSKISKNQEIDILELVNNNANDISLYVYKKHSEVYSFMSVREKLKISKYLERLNNNQSSTTYLILAEENNKIIGYILYQPSTHNPKDVSIISTIVNVNYRKQGILTLMMNALKNRSASITLSCFLDLVPIYQKLGFIVGEQWETQVGMYFNYFDDLGTIVTIDEEELYKSPTARLAMQEFQSKYTNYKYLLNVLNLETQNETQRVSKYFESL
ncbi:MULTISPECIES: GNAT family N-acetyltransferase [Flavobacterium]|uniref:GNAT family N-acetyltransferase n=1 Tax=Flavobacterium TaxID=237 RepID=UPI00211563D5|nr:MULTISPECIES: GNAT family N-acetyltransferase [Flavobacterium]UUF15198.1 GNAT family N-acetyltransferase [Flavobacterium panici]